MSKKVTTYAAILCIVGLLTCALTALSASAVGDDELPAAALAQGEEFVPVVLLDDLPVREFDQAALPAELSGEIPLYVNGIRIGDALTVEDAVYVPLRTFCEAMGAPLQISWDEERNTGYIQAGDLLLEAPVGAPYLVANGRYLYAPGGVLLLEDSVHVPLDALAESFGVTVWWDEAAAALNVNALELAPLTPAESFYNSEDLLWLSRVIHAEAGNQPLDGMIAVGNVVLNRVADPTCPNTVYDVIFDRRYGVQFSVTENGSIYLEPNENSVIAAKICLEGTQLVGASLFFVNPTVGASGWFARTRTFVTTIGEHDFYA